MLLGTIVQLPEEKYYAVMVGEDPYMVEVYSPDRQRIKTLQGTSRMHLFERADDIAKSHRRKSRRAKRTCLTCGQTFNSSHIGNRRCAECKRHYTEGMI